MGAPFFLVADPLLQVSVVIDASSLGNSYLSTPECHFVSRLALLKLRRINQGAE
jgi:hypothetical protein